VDVGAAAFIRQALIDLRNRGTAILVISEELDELFEICDRLAVIAKGRLSPAKRTRETNVEEIGQWMSGLWDAGDSAPSGPGAHTDDIQRTSAEATRADQA
jgi:simple sugar transport system ATP-binding protein